MTADQVDLKPADLGDADRMAAALQRELPGLVTSTDAGDWYVFYDPDGITEPTSRFPFCTLMTGDRYDAASDLDREPAAYRINVEVGRATYESLFGPAPREAAGMKVIDTGHDYTARDTVFPHPFYAPLHWVCVVQPGEQTRERLGQLVAESYGIAQRKYDNQRRRRP